MKIVLTALFALTACLVAGKQPNFILIFTDDQGYNDLGCFGSKTIKTPHLDQLAKKGRKFTSFYVASSVCSPSRAALLTGSYPKRVGMAKGVIFPSANYGLHTKEVTIADMLKEAGYATACVGKWHLGTAAPNIPNDRGFAFFHGFLGDMMNDYYHHKRGGVNWLRKNKEVVEENGTHATNLFTNWADAYLKDRSTRKDEPFFLFLAYNAPHFPIQPPKEWVEKVKKREPSMSEERVQAVAFVEHTDEQIGRILKSLEDYDLADNTVVFFTSDNGGSSPHFQENDPWRGGKQDHYDGGLRVPFAVRWPGTIKAGAKSDYQGLTFDIFPTCIESAGGKPREDLDAVSLLPLLKGEDFSTPDRELYFVRRDGGGDRVGMAYHALIKDGYKLMHNSPMSGLELYNLTQDPLETTDIFKKEPQRAQRMITRMERHIQRGGMTPWMGPEQ